MFPFQVQFWKDLIEKYLEPLLKNVEKEKQQAAGLIELRNQMVFSFFMLNAIFVIVVYLLQVTIVVETFFFFYFKMYDPEVFLKGFSSKATVT